MPDEKVIGRYILRGKLRLESPLLIGCGMNDGMNCPVLKDAEGIPYIPGASLGGALRHYFQSQFQSAFTLVQIEEFWGSERKNKKEKDTRSFQSSFFVSDLRPMNKPSIVVRDGIAIDRGRGVAKAQKKYDYEVIEPDSDFEFQAEVLLREVFGRETFEKIITLIMGSLKKGEIPLGAMTTKGFGRCRLLDGECLKYDFKKKEDVLNWLARDTEKAGRLEIHSSMPTSKAPDDLFLEVVLALKNSLLIRSYSGRPQDPDAVHISSNGRAILPGTSIKGALRARAERIMNTLGGPADSLKHLLGWASEGDEAGAFKQKSRLIVEESVICETETVKEQQTRIKIDRFTGGVIDSALFNSMSIWPKDPNHPMVVIKMRVRNCCVWEAGLLLLILKDLWTADLPIGGEKSIGRGVFTGVTATIRLKDKEYMISENGGALRVEGGTNDLENWVAAFYNHCNCGEVL
jgi:CRISPR/Cas system CSM-associated protein Csm3 (group 7 of RAMP superfamily)